MDVTSNGNAYPNRFSQVGVMAPVDWDHAADSAGSFVNVNGTSLAAPQVAGSAVLLKDLYIGNGFAAQISAPGVLFANIIAMGDRANSNTTYTDHGFDSAWGAGRFQARFWGGTDEPGLFRWETAGYTISAGQHIHHLVGGAGAEPAGIQLFKAYALFFEKDGLDVADIDLSLYDRACGAGAVLLNSDTSVDYKSMVKVGSTASGKDLCLDLFGYYVPAGTTRDVVVVAYYTDHPLMR